jgi:hypothetical protein
VLTSSRGSIGFVGLVFEVMTQVDLGWTSVSWFDSADSVISVRLLIKNLGRHKFIIELFFMGYLRWNIEHGCMAYGEIRLHS